MLRRNLFRLTPPRPSIRALLHGFRDRSSTTRNRTTPSRFSGCIPATPQKLRSIQQHLIDIRGTPLLLFPERQTPILEQGLDVAHPGGQDDLGGLTHPNGRLVGSLEAVDDAVGVAVGQLGDEVLAGLRRPARHAEWRADGRDHAAVGVGGRAVGADERVDVVEDAGVVVVGGTAAIGCFVLSCGLGYSAQ